MFESFFSPNSRGDVSDTVKVLVPALSKKFISKATTVGSCSENTVRTLFDRNFSLIFLFNHTDTINIKDEKYWKFNTDKCELIGSYPPR